METLLSCDACLRELPPDGAEAEVTDYVLHYCGLACHERWHAEAALRLADDGQCDCDDWLRQLPPDGVEAEVTDYVLHYCGLNCHARWHVETAAQP